MAAAVKTGCEGACDISVFMHGLNTNPIRLYNTLLYNADLRESFIKNSSSVGYMILCFFPAFTAVIVLAINSLCTTNWHALR